MSALLVAVACASLGQGVGPDKRVDGPQQSVVRSPHNLSASGPGTIKAAGENEVCIFCHAPHNSAPVQPLWNRSMPVEAYTIYSSPRLVAKPGQPTGMSKMCLSCHDGTIALGSILSRGAPIPMSGGSMTLPEGHGRIGTDLRDDHPISFRYDNALASKNRRLLPPSALPGQLRLDGNSELQCTTCHDAHNNSLGDFLTMRNDHSQLCISCHQVGKTDVQAHGNCNACHQQHGSPSGPFLLRRKNVTATCLACHDGSVSGAVNVATALRRASTHDTDSPVDPTPPLSNHVNCADCHEPHTMSHGSGGAAGLPPNFGRVAGVSDSGAQQPVAVFEHGVCFKCHADTATNQPTISRQAQQNNLRLKFSASAVSFHPVMAPGKNPSVPSLLPGWTTASRVRCTDCHDADSSLGVARGTSNGVHGSAFAPLLGTRYDTADYTTESAEAYGLCYKCHDRNSILGDTSFSKHRLHIVQQRTPCAACHDAHGVSSGSALNHSNLINFATAIVQPARGSGRFEYRDLGQFRGECYLSCHGVTHAPAAYP